MIATPRGELNAAFPRRVGGTAPHEVPAPALLVDECQCRGFDAGLGHRGHQARVPVWFGATLSFMYQVCSRCNVEPMSTYGANTRFGAGRLWPQTAGDGAAGAGCAGCARARMMASNRPVPAAPADAAAARRHRVRALAAVAAVSAVSAAAEDPAAAFAVAAVSAVAPVKWAGGPQHQKLATLPYLEFVRGRSVQSGGQLHRRDHCRGCWRDVEQPGTLTVEIRHIDNAAGFPGAAAGSRVRGSVVGQIGAAGNWLNSMASSVMSPVLTSWDEIRPSPVVNRTLATGLPC